MAEVFMIFAELPFTTDGGIPDPLHRVYEKVGSSSSPRTAARIERGRSVLYRFKTLPRPAGVGISSSKTAEIKNRFISQPLRSAALILLPKS